LASFAVGFGWEAEGAGGVEPATAKGVEVAAVERHWVARVHGHVAVIGADELGADDHEQRGFPGAGMNLFAVADAFNGGGWVGEFPPVDEEDFEGAVEAVDVAGDGADAEVAAVAVDEDEVAETVLLGGVGEVADDLHERFGAEGEGAAKGGVFQAGAVGQGGEQGGVQAVGNHGAEVIAEDDIGKDGQVGAVLFHRGDREDTDVSGIGLPVEGGFGGVEHENEIGTAGRECQAWIGGK